MQSQLTATATNKGVFVTLAPVDGCSFSREKVASFFRY